MVNHLLYGGNSGFWRWVTGGRGNPVGIGEFPGLGQPLSRPIVIRANSEALVEFKFFHFSFSLAAAGFGRPGHDRNMRFYAMQGQISSAGPRSIRRRQMLFLANDPDTRALN